MKETTKMTPKKTKAVLRRLKVIADHTGIPAPLTIVASDGAPSVELLAFCDKTGLTLDYAVCGKGRMWRDAQPAKNLSELQNDATQLHGMLQGLELHLDQINAATPLHNAIHAAAGQIVTMAGRLADGLDALGTTQKGGAL